jgi:hypothetical protein
MNSSGMMCVKQALVRVLPFPMLRGTQEWRNFLLAADIIYDRISDQYLSVKVMRILESVDIRMQ